MKVLNIGSLNLDYVYQVDHFVSPGETLASISQEIKAGGKGLNQTIALKKAGVDVYHAGCIGKGGEILKEELIKNQVDVSFLCEVDELQGNAVIQVTKNGENGILLSPGSNHCITEKRIDDWLKSFSKDDILILQNEINMLPEIVDKAYKKGLRIFLNPSPYNEEIEKVDLKKIHWLLMNEVEAKQISGSEEPDETWKELYRKYSNLSVLITMGSKGSVAYQRHGKDVEIEQCNIFPVKAVDTTAAGDTYTGFFIQGILNELPLRDCMRRASMASAISVTRKGAATSIPTKEEVEEKLLVD